MTTQVGPPTMRLDDYSSEASIEQIEAARRLAGRLRGLKVVHLNSTK